MLFNSYIFCFFFLPLALLSFVLAARVAPRKIVLVWLIILSLAFYAWWNPPYVAMIIGSVVANYIFARLLWRTQSRALLALGIALNLGLLGYYKYAGFLTTNIDLLFGLGWSVGHIVLPLAISFFTFNQIGFLVDTYRHEDWSRGPLEYAGFVTFFPHLIAGPIVYHKELAPQFQGLGFGRVNTEDLAVGFSLFAMGLFKKIVIADAISPYSDAIFSAAAQGNSLGFYASWLGTLAFCLQIYFDFSAYSDMALGLARMFGIRLPINFNSPYKANGFSDFWKRWHMTLSRFLMHYLYFALGGNRRGELLTYVNLIIVMLLGGLWHGAGWTFVAWGGLHGILLTFNHGWRRHAPAAARQWGRDGTGRYLGIAITFLGTTMLWVFFRAANFDAAKHILTGMAGLHGFNWSALPHYYPRFAGVYAQLSGFGIPWSQTSVVIGFLVCCFAIVWLLPNSEQILGHYKPGLNTFKEGIYRWQTAILSWRPNWAWGLAMGVLAWLAIQAVGTPRPFVYFHF